jgi:hypothetical protein
MNYKEVVQQIQKTYLNNDYNPENKYVKRITYRGISTDNRYYIHIELTYSIKDRLLDMVEVILYDTYIDRPKIIYKDYFNIGKSRKIFNNLLDFSKLLNRFKDSLHFRRELLMITYNLPLGE